MVFMKLTALLLAATAAFFDLKTGRIPNKLCLSGLALGLILQTALSPLDPFGGLLRSLLGLLLPFGLLFLPYCLRMIGAGDVKLLMALGAITGWPGSLRLLFAALLCGSLLALGIMAGRTGFRPRASYFLRYLRLLLSGIPVPYREEGQRPENMHFAVSVLFGTVVWLIIW